MLIRSQLLLCALLATAAPLAPAHAAPETAPKRVEVSARATVQSAGGKPIAGADIAIQTSDNKGNLAWRAAQTDAQGRFDIKASFASPSEEDETVTGFVHAAGYALQEFFIAPDGRVATREGGENQTGDTIAISPATATVKGIVTDDKGAPAEGVAVALSYLETGSANRDYRFVGFGNAPLTPALDRVLRARTDKNGAWQLNDLPIGYRATIDTNDPRFQNERISQITGKVAAPALKTALKVGARVRGRVVFPDGKPVPDASVNISVSDANGNSTAAGETSDAEGNYEVFGLGAGTAIIKVAPPDDEWAPSGLTGVALKIGVQTSAPDVKLSRGVTLAGTVTEEGAKTPIAGAMVMADGPFGMAQSTPTDDKGRYTVRTALGQTRFYLFSTPDDYLRNWGDERNLNVAPATKVAGNFTLRRGVTLRGTAFDGAGKPATGAAISAGGGYGGQFTRVDDAGNWTLRGVDPVDMQPGQTPADEDGKVTLKTDGAWGIVGPARVFVKTTEPIRLKMRRLDLQDVAVHIVTAEGKPLAGAEVVVTKRDANGSTFRQTMLSDAKGVVTVPQLRPDESAELTPKVAGYSVKMAGKVVTLGEAKNKIRAVDAVMVALNRTLAGRVLDVAGVPVGDVRVALLSQIDARDSTEFARTDAAGNWRFEGLAPGEIRVGAAREREWGMAMAADKAKNVEIRLSAPRGQPRPNDRERARALISDWLVDADKTPSFDLMRLAVDFARVDPESAPALAALMEPRSRAEFEQSVQRATRDPQSAIANARERAQNEEELAYRDGAQLELIGLLIATDRAEATRLYRELAPTEKPADADALMFATYRDATSLGLAGALDQPVANRRAALVRDLAAHAPEDLSFRLGGYIGAIAANDMAGALEFSRTLPPQQQVRALEEIVPLVAKSDLPRAQLLLAEMEKLVALPDLPVEAPRDDAMYRATPAESLDSARTAIVRQLMPTDPQAAYDLARQMSVPVEVNDMAIQASLLLPPAQTLAALRAAFEGAKNGAADDIARLAALAAPLDGALSEQWFSVARARMAGQAEVSDSYRPGAAPYAFYRAASDSAQSRLLLENEWTRLSAAGVDGGIRPFFDTVWAVAPLDFERALAMLGQTQASFASDHESMEETAVKRELILWLLSSETQRQQLRFRYPTGAVLPEGAQ